MGLCVLTSLSICRRYTTSQSDAETFIATNRIHFKLLFEDLFLFFSRHPNLMMSQTPLDGFAGSDWNITCPELGLVNQFRPVANFAVFRIKL